MLRFEILIKGRYKVKTVRFMVSSSVNGIDDISTLVHEISTAQSLKPGLLYRKMSKFLVKDRAMYVILSRHKAWELKLRFKPAQKCLLCPSQF